MDELVTITLKGVPKEVRKEFKTMCAEREISMQDRLIHLMKEDIIDHGMAK